MPRRYTFWRTPTGTRYKGNDDKYAPTALLAELGTSATVDDQGRVNWRAPWFLGFDVALRAAIVILSPDGELNETDAWSILFSAIRSVIKKRGAGKPVSASELLREADKHAARHFGRKPADYVLVSSLSLESFPATRIKVRQCEVAPLRGRGKRYPYPDALKLQFGHPSIAGWLTSGKYHWVRVKTAGRTVHEAAQNGLDALNLLRGLWTLFATYRSWSITIGRPRTKPLGIIHTGPFHTLHYTNGALAGNVYWYESDFGDPQPLFKPSRGWAQIEKTRRAAARRIKGLPFRKELERLIIRYAGALDQTNLDVAFLGLWGILEKLTDTVGANYDETIRRALWGFKDRDVAKEMLESLRFRRNRYVHAAESGEARDQVAYMMKWFVDPHLIGLIRDDLRLQTLEEYAQYLALPTDIRSLETRKRRAGRALRILKKGSRST